MWFLPGKTAFRVLQSKNTAGAGTFHYPAPAVQALSIGAFAVISGTLGPRPTLATAFRHNSLLLKFVINLPIFTYSPLSRKPGDVVVLRKICAANRFYESLS